MGNNPSSPSRSSSGRPRRNSRSRPTKGGASRTPNYTPEELAKRRELENFCQLHGIYETCEWSQSAIREQILGGHVAPLKKGSDDGEEEKIEAGEIEECPICFLFYDGGLNRATCCKESLCTECYFQVKGPGKTPSSCPFCQSMSFRAVFSGPLSEDEKMRREVESQKVLELSIAKRNSDMALDNQIMAKIAQGMTLDEALKSINAPATPEVLARHTPPPTFDSPLHGTPPGSRKPSSNSRDFLDEVLDMSPPMSTEEQMIQEAIRLSMLEQSMSDSKSSTPSTSPHKTRKGSAPQTPSSRALTALASREAKQNSQASSTRDGSNSTSNTSSTRSLDQASARLSSSSVREEEEDLDEETEAMMMAAAIQLSLQNED